MARNPKVAYAKLFDFSGGLNDTASVLKALPTEALEALNINLDRDGAVTRRSGSVKVNSVSYGGAHECGLMYQFMPALGTSKLIAAFDDYIAEINTGTGVKTDLITGLTPNQIFLPVPFLNLLYLFNKSDVPLVYYPGAGSSPYIFRPGMPQPTATPATGADVAGSMTASANVWVRVRFVSIIDDSFIGEPYPEGGFQTSIGVSGGRTLTNILAYPGGASPADFRVAKRVIERTLEGAGPADFYEDGFIPDNSATTYDLGSKTDADLLVQFPMPDLGTRKPTPSLWPVTVHGRRIIGHEFADQGNVVFSEIDEFGVLPEAFADENFQRLEVTDFVDDVIACEPLGEYVNWYCGRSIHQTFIDPSGSPYTRKLVAHKLGVPSARGVVSLPTGHIFWSNKGPYLFDGKNLIFIGERIEELIKDTPKTNMDKLYAVHRTQEFRRQILFVMPSQEDATKNTQAAVYHYRRVTLNPLGFPTEHAWTVHKGWDAKAGYLGQTDATRQEVEWSGSYDGHIYQEDIGSDDAHEATGQIDGRFTTIWMDMGAPDQIKHFTDLWLIFASAEAPTVSVTWETSFGEGPSGSAQLALQPSSESKFGTAVFGSAQFARQENRIVHTFLAADGITAVGRYLRLRFSNTASGEGFTLAGFMVKWQSERDRDDQIP